MIGDMLMKGLVVFYIILILVYLWERQWPKAMYWLGAAILNIGILWGMNGK